MSKPWKPMDPRGFGLDKCSMTLAKIINESESNTLKSYVGGKLTRWQNMLNKIRNVPDQGFRAYVRKSAYKEYIAQVQKDNIEVAEIKTYLLNKLSAMYKKEKKVDVPERVKEPKGRGKGIQTIVEWKKAHRNERLKERV